eukprot:14773897-Heterocapsa_arctica.AAC.1
MPEQLRVGDGPPVADLMQLVGEVLLPILRCTSETVQRLADSPTISWLLLRLRGKDVDLIVAVQLCV